MTNTAVALIIISQQILAAIVFAFPPILYHSGKFVGVPVAQEFTRSPEGRALLHGWWKFLALVTLICAGLAIGGSIAADDPMDSRGIAGAGFALSCLAEVILLLSGIMLMRRKALRHALTPAPTALRVASLRPRDQLPGRGLLRFLMFAPLFLFVLAFIYLLLRWDSIPERFPMHWNARGQIDNWGTRRPADVFAPLVVGLFAYVLIAAIWKLKIVSTGLKPRGRLAYELLISGLPWFIAAVTCSGAIVMPFMGGAGLKVILVVGVTTPLILIVVFSIIWSRLSKDLPPDPLASAVEVERMQERHWRWGGLFYYNADDPALWVEKKVGLGTTPNMAHKAAWIPLLLILLFAFSLPLLIPLALRLMK